MVFPTQVQDMCRNLRLINGDRRNYTGLTTCDSRVEEHYSILCSCSPQGLLAGAANTAASSAASAATTAAARTASASASCTETASASAES